MSRNPWQSLKNVVKNSFYGCCYVGYAGCVFHLITEYICDPVLCQGPSMEPTLHEKDVILTEHISSMRYKFHRGDIVIVRSPSNPRNFLCKRIKGMPGDKVRKLLSTEVVPQGHVWLEGDNKSNSSDSREFGAVPIGLIRSRAIFRIYPFGRAGFLH